MHRKHDCEYLNLSDTLPTDKQQPAVPWQLTAHNELICEFALTYTNIDHLFNVMLSERERGVCNVA